MFLILRLNGAAVAISDLFRRIGARKKGAGNLRYADATV
jgi:hypothetical protein